MKTRNAIFAGLCLVFISLLVVPGALMADEASQSTKVSFNEPFEVPGHVLQGGTYWFTLMDSSSDRNIIQIWNEDRSQLLATILAVSDYRLRPTGKTVINFDERPSNEPEAVQAWFYPGENFGHEFVYPKERASTLALQNHQPVLSMTGESSSETVPVPPALNAIMPTGEEVELSSIVRSEEQTSEEEVKEQAPQHQVERLPQTASPLPLLAFLGLSIAGAGVCLLCLKPRVV